MAKRKVESFDEFKIELQSNEKLQAEFREDPAKAIAEFQQHSPLATDKWIYRIVVMALGISILVIILGVLVLHGMGKITKDIGVPTILTATGSAAIGAIAGLLAPSPKGT